MARGEALREVRQWLDEQERAKWWMTDCLGRTTNILGKDWTSKLILYGEKNYPDGDYPQELNIPLPISGGSIVIAGVRIRRGREANYYRNVRATIIEPDGSLSAFNFGGIKPERTFSTEERKIVTNKLAEAGKEVGIYLLEKFRGDRHRQIANLPPTSSYDLERARRGIAKVLRLPGSDEKRAQYAHKVITLTSEILRLAAEAERHGFWETPFIALLGYMIPWFSFRILLIDTLLAIPFGVAGGLVHGVYVKRLNNRLFSARKALEDIGHG